MRSEVAYVSRGRIPIGGQADQRDQELTLFYRQAHADGLDQLDFQELGAIADDLANLSDRFASQTPPASLPSFAADWSAAQAADIAAARALLAARLSVNPTQQTALLQTVGTQLQARDQQREAATLAFSQVLPIGLTPQ